MHNKIIQFALWMIIRMYLDRWWRLTEHFEVLLLNHSLIEFYQYHKLLYVYNLKHICFSIMAPMK